MREQLQVIREVVNFLNMFLICKSKHAIKSAIPETEKKQNKGTCDQIMRKYINKI